MFDPTYPPLNADIESAPLRGQFNGLHDLIVALNAIAAAQVDAVNTINHNEPATATVNLVGNTLHFSFGIPQGNDGGPGPQGQQGPPFATAIVDTVNTVDPGQPASVQTSFDGSNVRFHFGIPRGNDGSNGSDGSQGPPGEISQAQLDSAIAGTSALLAEPNWPRFAGPDGSSHSTETSLPVKWDASAVLWKAKLKGTGQYLATSSGAWAAPATR